MVVENGDNGIGIPNDGSKVMTPQKTETWQVLFTNSQGQDSCRIKIYVQAPTPAPKCDFFNLSKTNITKGESIRASWGSTNADSARMHIIENNNNGIGIPVDGYKIIKPLQTQTWQVVFYNSKGQKDSCQQRVIVTDKPTPPTPTPSCDYFNTSNYTIEKGDVVTLSWGTSNAGYVSIDQGVGRVSADGSKTIRVYRDTRFTLTAIGANDKRDNCSVLIRVTDKPTPPTPTPSCDYFRVSDSRVEEGDRVTLKWGTTNADEVYIDNGVGNVRADGETDVRVYEDTRFRLTAKNDKGDESSCSVFVEVEDEDDRNKDPRPRCELDISDDVVRVGDEVTLYWETDYADEVVIEDSRGREIYDDDVSRHDDGDIDVIVTRDTEFTLTARGDGGRRTCKVDVEVEDSNVLILSERDQGKVAGIALTQVPYTGFEAGPFLTILFYSLLVMWALAVAYFLVIRRDSVLGFALPGNSNSVSLDEGESYVDNASANYKMAVGEASTVDTPDNLPTGEIPMMGYASYTTDEVEESKVVDTDDGMLEVLESLAKDKKVLISAGAVRQFHNDFAGFDNETEVFADLMTMANETYPTEDGWIVVNAERMQAMLNSLENQNYTKKASLEDSLTKAIVNGDVTKAYQAISHRPMFALADAAAQLDAAYRARNGADTDIEVSESVMKTISSFSDDEIKQAIAALTSALDGTYQSESEAVKMAVMKAVNVFARQ